MGRVIMMRPIIVFFITVVAKKTEVLNPFTKIHGQFTVIYVHIRKKNREILALFPPILHANQKERSHDRLGFFK